MKILHLSHTITAAAPMRFVDLINRYTSHEAKLFQVKSFFMGQPINVPIVPIGQIEDALKWADVLHFHGSQIFDRRRIVYRGKRVNIGKYYRKPYVLHYHGSPHRESPGKYIRHVPKLLLSTPEMLPLFKACGAKFFPNLIDETASIYKQRKHTDNKIRVCHHFSLHRKKKDTDFFEAAMAKFVGKENLILSYIPRGALLSTLQGRAEHDVVFDHLQGYYGLVSIEGMAQELCVINGCGVYRQGSESIDVMDELQKFFGAKPPFLITDRKKFFETLSTLSPDIVNDYAARGKEFMNTHWSGKENIKRLIEVYKKL